ncbi:MAG: hypothetical protein E6Q24_04890 [Chitinophagaceae bacterium]|nr:MAG: hypothetical protein E6Q24_04890 [Chitinophagaceae bacterium]
MRDRLTRRNKPYQFVLSKDNPYKASRQVFAALGLEVIREELEAWKELSLSNDHSVYERGEARENLMRFCKSLGRMVEAMYLVTRKNKGVKKKREKIDSALEVGENNIAVGDISLYLTKKEERKPALVIRQHFKMFSLGYSRIEVRDMLDAVITYKGENGVNRSSLLIFHKCLKVLINSANTILK